MKLTRHISLFLMLVVGNPFTACTLVPTEEPPGVGEKADRGYAVSAPIINALEQYKYEKGAYPDSLDELVPDYLTSIPSEVNDNPLAYKKTDESFSLSFYYLGPGMNACTYTPENAWRCSGAY